MISTNKRLYYQYKASYLASLMLSGFVYMLFLPKYLIKDTFTRLCQSLITKAALVNV